MIKPDNFKKAKHDYELCLVNYFAVLKIYGEGSKEVAKAGLTCRTAEAAMCNFSLKKYGFSHRLIHDVRRRGRLNWWELKENKAA